MLGDLANTAAAAAHACLCVVASAPPCFLGLACAPHKPESSIRGSTWGKVGVDAITAAEPRAIIVCRLGTARARVPCVCLVCAVLTGVNKVCCIAHDTAPPLWPRSKVCCCPGLPTIENDVLSVDRAHVAVKTRQRLASPTQNVMAAAAPRRQHHQRRRHRPRHLHTLAAGPR